MKKLTLEDFQIRLKEAHPTEDLIALSYNGGREKCNVKCRTCQTEYTKNGEYFLDKRKKSICKNCFPTQPNQKKENWLPPEGYTRIGEYKGMHHKVLVKHDECGFIWEITPSNLKLGKGCPKCNKRVSKGEQRIIKFLDSHNIQYTTQLPLNINNHHLTIDFYLPTFDIYIEYNGEQHYHPVKHFGGDAKFLKQQEYDNIKRDFLKEKLLTISYLEFENIEKILESSTTISKESTTETFAVGSGKSPTKENDIV